ncbi:cysteine dioxygenase [Acetobacteraceae bacterium KSS8]|uniref:Cysteine dioxygenase n=1 Tax=Endosaccharibacter trunci TaxID=2812733 RepID=A0ABT1W5H3_9PROT|nr:cysteine dioxygenase [Acetobacteraceae bacterium KSS8]
MSAATRQDIAAVADPGRLRGFVADFTRLIERDPDQGTVLGEGGALLAALIERDDWLDERFAQPHPQFYQQFLLHCDPLERFSVVSFVWGPGQRTPIHDHRVWGLIGVLRGGERETRFERGDDGRLRETEEAVLPAGAIATLSPEAGDLHRVSNLFGDRVSLSIHVYGANIGAVKRATFDEETGVEKSFVSGYAADLLPNLWDRSAAVRAS